MNYDPIHDTYSENSDSAANRETNPSMNVPHPANSTGADTLRENHTTVEHHLANPTQNLQNMQGDQLLKREPVLPSEHNVQPEPAVKVENAQSVQGYAETHQKSPHQVATAQGAPEQSQSTESDEDKEPLPPGTLPSTFRSVSRGFKHLKKADGEPFWRKDIQYSFLEALFNDTNAVFTNNFPFCEVPHAANGPKLTFAELYVRTLAESLKLSKVLRERLIKDREMGVAVSKVCLLVNAGRMNTTVNFVPDMRLALRTYHLIPSLQADPNGPLKPLQDTPRLKTILKAVCDGHDHLQTLLDLLRTPPTTKPNTSVIKLIFLMSTFFQNIPFHYDDLYDHDLFLEKLRFIKALPGPQNKFMEFFLNDEIRPENRARRFLWLMYTYLETSFTPAELAANPFNPRVIPPLEYLSDAELAACDVDPPYEVEYAVQMYHARMLHLHGDDRGSAPRKRKEEEIEEPVAEEPEEVPVPEEPRLLKPILKRKKPTPLVGSLVDDSKKPLGAAARWRDVPFPLVRERLARFARSTSGVAVRPLSRDSPHCVARRRATMARARALVAQVARALPVFEARRTALPIWLRRYFQYKKQRDGLLALEWEALRNDVAGGIESYLYQQMGKAQLTRRYEEQADDEPDARHESFVGGGQLPGDAAPVDLASMDKVGAGFVATHDFDRANERSAYELLLVTMAGEVQQEERPLPRVSFDLESETVEFA